MSASDIEVSVEDMAEILGTSVRWVQQLATDQVIPKAERGRYPAIGAASAYIRHLQTSGKSVGADELQRERTILARTQREEIELRIAEKRRELIPASEIEPSWSGFVASARAQLRAEPERLAHILDTMEGVPQKAALLADTFDAFLRRLSGYDPELETPADTAPQL